MKLSDNRHRAKRDGSFDATFGNLCGCEWLCGTYFGRFWGFMVDYEAVVMGQVLPLG